MAHNEDARHRFCARELLQAGLTLRLRHHVLLRVCDGAVPQHDMPFKRDHPPHA